MEEPQNREDTRNPDGTFKSGVSGNPGGRPKNTIKDYLSRKFSNMSDEEKEDWLIQNKVSAEVQWQMAEGRPSQGVGQAEDLEPLAPVLVKFLDGENNRDTA